MSVLNRPALSARLSEYAQLAPAIVGAPIICVLVLILLRSSSVASVSPERAAIGVTILIIVTTMSYIAMARRVASSLVIRERDLPNAVLLFAAIGALLILQCAALGWVPYDLVVATDAARHGPGRLSEMDGLYFSAVTFTTLGYGDFVPAAGAGRCLAMYEALLGSAHSVFFILIFLKGGALTVPESDAKGRAAG